MWNTSTAEKYTADKVYQEKDFTNYNKKIFHFIIMFLSTLIIVIFLMKGTTSLNQLSFSGGGSFGAVEIGIVKYIAEKDPNKAYDK